MSALEVATVLLMGALTLLALAWASSGMSR